MRHLAKVFLFLLIPALWVYAGETLQGLTPPRSIPLESVDYVVNSVGEDPSKPGFLKFHVRSPHAEYEVEGWVALKKLLREIEVMEYVKSQGRGQGFLDGAADSVTETGEGFVNLFAHPIRSVAGLGKAAAKLGRKIGGVFRKKEKGEKTTFAERRLGGSKREIAKELGVDVYSTNPHLQELLTRMAKARMAGKAGAAVVRWFLPVTDLASVTMTASGINSAADQRVNDTDRVELFRLNRKALEKLGLSQHEVKRFLNLPYYSPREATYFRFYLEALKEWEGFREVLRAAIRAENPGEARKILYEAQIAAEERERIPNGIRIQCLPEGLAISERVRVILITPYDYLDVSPLGEQVLNRALTLQREGQKETVEIWNGGGLAPAFSDLSSSQEVRLRSWLLF